MIPKCYISLQGSLNPSAVLKFRDKGVFESIYNVKILNTFLSLNFNTANGLRYSQHQFDQPSSLGEGSPSPVCPRTAMTITLEMKDKKKINQRNS